MASQQRRKMATPLKKSIIVFTILALTTLAYAQVKRADLAGTWYPGGKAQLAAQLNGYLDKAQPPQVDGKIIALIAPHAGLVYSGPVAAYGFKAVKDMDIDTVIVVGFSHRRYYDGVAVLDADAYQTPLGKININKNAVTDMVGTLLLLFIAIAIFSIVYIAVFSFEAPTREPTVNIIGKLNLENDSIIFEHHGGENLVLNKEVRLEKDVTDKDSYSRLLRYVYVDDIFVNEYLILNGYAYSNPYPPDTKYQTQLNEAENEAREKNKGLWKVCETADVSPTSDVFPSGRFSNC